MAQFAIMIFEAKTPGGWADLPPEVMAAHEQFPGKIEELGGKIVNGFALEPAATARGVRGEVVTDGPFLESKEVLGGFFVIEARDIEHATAIAKLTPIASGGVEVRPLLSA